MSLAPVITRPGKALNEPPSAPPQKSAEELPVSPRRRRVSPKRFALGLLEGFAAFAVFGLWLLLFAAGILVDTRPYRELISPSAVAAMDSEAAPATPSTGGAARTAATEAPAAAAVPPAAQDSPPATWTALGTAWLVVLLAYLPLNLAWLCATASTLGTFGSRVNLSDDTERESSRDNTSPYVSALLRGFFVYLFMTSGLLLLDETPFSSPSPGQYIRLAGFLSLFSFVISYQPRLFTALVVSAFQRIQVRDRSQDDESLKRDADVVVRKEATKTEEIVVKNAGDAGADKE